ncbi:MAG: enolase C-terminal domain-like protein [Acidimicrobiia bacterium]
MPVIAATLHALALPMNAAFRNAQTSADLRRVVLVEVAGEAAGWGEAAPFPGQDERLDVLIASAREGIATPTLAAALDEATADSAARWAGDALESFGASVPVCLAIGLDDPAAAISDAVDLGVRRFKVKVAGGKTSHVADIRKQFPTVAIGVDGNGSMTPGEWDTAEVASLELSFAEELFSEMTDGAVGDFTAATGVPMFADESVRSVTDAHALIASAVPIGITIKPGRLGWSGARQVRDLCVASKRPFRFSGLLESSIGRSFTDRLATDPRATFSDVAPASWFLKDVVSGAGMTGGSVEIPTGAGMGRTPDPELLEAYRTDRIEVLINRQADRDRD